MPRKQTPYLTIGQAAEHLGLAVDTVRRLEAKGELKALRTAGGHRRFPREAVEAFRARRDATATRRSPRPRLATPRRGPTPARRPQTTAPHRPPPLVDSPDDEPDEFWADPEEWHESEQASPPRRRSTPTQVFSPPATGPARPTEVSDMESVKKAREEQQRLRGIKAHGVQWIPYGVPAKWHAKVIDDLDRYVTADRFPDWVSEWEAQRVVRGRVEDVLKPYREEAAEEAARRKQSEDASRRAAVLIDHGVNYARQETYSDWDYTPACEARREVEERLKAEIKANWTELRVRDRVDEILSQWEGEDEDDEDDDYDDE